MNDYDYRLVYRLLLDLFVLTPTFGTVGTFLGQLGHF